ncbi:hypothetical protein MTP99_008670 [Tenebrio molitor]|nr:hypothetical protein MTP99_008670 [Tenebrio molitor]
MANYDWTSAIKVHITCFRLLGFWPKNEGYNLDLYTLWTVFAAIFFGFVQTFIETVEIFTNLSDLEIVTRTAFLSFSELLVLLKVFYLTRNTKTFKRLLVTLNSAIFQPTSEQMSLILPELNSWKLTYKVLCICGFVTVASLLLIPMFQVRRLPFLAWYPFDATVSPNYEIAYVHQSISVSYISICNVHIDTLIGAMSMYTAAQLTILKDNLRKLKPEEFQEGLVRCVKHHREVLKFAKSFNDVFNWIILVQFFASAISIGFSMFLVTIVSPFSEEFFSFAFYGFSSSFEIFIYCWFANEIQVKSDQVPLSAFQSDWLGASEEAKKSLIIFMANAQRPLKISALNLFDLSLDTFLKSYDWTSTIKINIFMFRIVGLWPQEHGYSLNFYTFYAILSVGICGFAQSFFQTVKLFGNLNDLEIVTGTAFLCFSELLVVLKMFYLARNIKTFRLLLVTLNSDMFQPTSEQIKLVLPDLKLWKLMYKLLWCSISVAIVFWSLVPIVDTSFQERQLPFLAWYPFDAKTSPFFEMTYIHQTVSICYITAVNVNLDTLIAAMSMYTGAQLDILSNNLRKLRPEEFEEELTRCVEHHKEIVKFAKTFNSAFNWTIFVQFFASAISIGFSMFLMTIVVPFSKEFVSYTFYGTSAFLEIFIYCWFGNEVQVKSNEVPLAAYESNWVEASKGAKKNLILFMMNAQRSLRISALNLFDLSLENFLKILKSSWSYFALVSQLNE